MNTVFDEEVALVFYPRTIKEYERVLGNLVRHKIKFEKALNPYWNLSGVMILDLDGHPVIISNLNEQ